MDSIPPVIFLTGLPGSGKGTISQELLSENPTFRHFSVGDILRVQRDDPKAENHLLIKNILDNGKVVPAEVAIGLMRKKIESLKKVASVIIIDGFPRSLEQMETYHRLLGLPTLVLDFQINEDVIFERVRHRRREARESGRPIRDDDKDEVVRKRIATYHKETKPVTDAYWRHHPEIIRRVVCAGPISDVLAQVRRFIAEGGLRGG